MYHTYDGANCSKILTNGISNNPKIKNIISLNRNLNIPRYSFELLVHIWTSAVNGLRRF